MIVRLQKIETTVEGDRIVSLAPPAEPPMIANRVSIPTTEPATDRRLRNWLIFANIVAWVAIISVIRLIFF
jgi:hypothetical protein